MELNNFNLNNVNKFLNLMENRNIKILNPEIDMYFPNGVKIDIKNLSITHSFKNGFDVMSVFIDKAYGIGIIYRKKLEDTKYFEITPMEYLALLFSSIEKVGRYGVKFIYKSDSEKALDKILGVDSDIRLYWYEQYIKTD